MKRWKYPVDRMAHVTAEEILELCTHKAKSRLLCENKKIYAYTMKTMMAKKENKKK
jgi:hypothetical protein